MKDEQVKAVTEHIEISWPLAEIPGQTPTMWAKDLVLLECFECAILAVDALRRSQEYPPSSAIYLQQYHAVHKNNPEHQPKQLAAPALQESDYMLAAKALIFGPGAELLSTPTAELDVEGAGLRAKILDAGARHQEALARGGRPTADMLAEVSNLGIAVQAWYDPRKAGLETAKVARQRRQESKFQQRAAAGVVESKPRGRKSRR